MAGLAHWNESSTDGSKGNGMSAAEDRSHFAYVGNVSCTAHLPAMICVLWVNKLSAY